MNSNDKKKVGFRFDSKRLVSFEKLPNSKAKVVTNRSQFGNDFASSTNSRVSASFSCKVESRKKP